MTTLEISDLRVTYGANAALHGVSLEVLQGTCTALLGTNGAGKSSMLNAIAGVVPSTGIVRLGGRDLSDLPAYRRARTGVGLVPEEHHLFPTMTVRDTLLLAAGRGADGHWTIDEILALFPKLDRRLGSLTGTLSGGERQMVALARALLLNPEVLLLDEPSAGLAPRLFYEVLDAVRLVTERGQTVLLAEQNVVGARRIADDFAILRDGVLYQSQSQGTLDEQTELTQLLWGT